MPTRNAGSSPAERYPNVTMQFDLHGIRLRNRIVRCAHGTALARGVVSDELIEFHRARAAGGVGLMILGDGIVHSSASGVLPLWQRDVVPGLRRLGDAIHAEGAAVFQQLSHQGAAALDATPPWSASAVPLLVSGRVPIAMSSGMIGDVVEGFATSALHCREAGFDGIEVHAGHGFLIGQFLSPATNHRTDEYGGDLEGRSRILREVLDAVRSAVGEDFAVGVRMSVTDNMVDGVDVDEAIILASYLDGLRQVDFFDLSVGHLNSYASIIGGMHEPHGYQVPASSRVASAVSVPSLLLGRIHTLAEAEALLASGACDLVGMTRSTIADPDLVVKSLAGRETEVRPCVACNYCVASMTAAERRLACAVNVSVGRETSLGAIELSPQRRRVLVVGGGPAGLEAAIVGAERGHEVVLCEEAPELGGSLTVASTAPGRSDLAAIVNWQAARARALGVDIRLRCSVTPEVLTSASPDAVILATGSRPRRDGMQAARPGLHPTGVERSHVRSPAEVLVATELRPSNAVIVDDIGGNEATSVAEALAQRGARVVIVTRYAEAAAGLGANLEKVPTQTRLAACGVQVVAHSVLMEVLDTEVVVSSLLDGSVRTIPADVVVMALPGQSRDELMRHLAAWGGEVHAVGDAVAPRDLTAAIAEGHLAGRAV